jgi:hypothetical protein
MGCEADSPVQYFEKEIPVWYGLRSGVFEFRYKQVCVQWVTEEDGKHWVSS